VRASGGFGILFNCRKVNVIASEFCQPSEGIFYGPIHLSDTSKIYVVTVYRTKNTESAVYDENFHSSLNQVLSTLANEKVILGGDFNACLGDLSGVLGIVEDAQHLIPTKAESPAADDAGADLLATLLGHDVAAVHDMEAGQVLNTFQNWKERGGSLIDYVFVNRSVLPFVHTFKCFHYEIRNHAKLTLTLRLPRTIGVDNTPATLTAALRPRVLRLFNLDKLKELQHTEGLLRLASSGRDFDVRTAFDTLLEFVDEYTEEVTLKPGKDERERKVTVRARQEARRTERRLRKEKNEEVRSSLRALWSQQVKQWHELRDRDNAKEISRARVQFYEAIRNRNLHKAWKIAQRKLPGKGGGISRSATDALSREAWESHFASLFTTTGGPQLTSPSPGQTDPGLDAPFTALEVSQMLERKKNHRALRPDGFSVDHLRVLCYDEVTCMALANFFNLCVSVSDIPDEWDHAFLHVLYKGKGPVDDPNNFRGITLKSQMLKMLESLLCDCLRCWAEINGKLLEEQIAYRPGKMGTDHLFSLTVLRERNQTRRRPLFSAFVDLKKAFPSIDRQRLLNKLSSLGVSDHFLRVITRLYSKDTFSLLLDGVPSESVFEVSRGVHEGSLLSPLLFILYISDLVEHLRRTGADAGGIKLDNGTIISCILYADDVLLLAETPEALQTLINETARYFEAEGMTVNPFKSEIVNFSTSRSTTNATFTIASVGKELLKEAKYLGVLFERNFSWKSQRESIALRCRVALGRCKMICASLQITKLSTLIQIYDMFVSSIFRYSAGAWGPLATNLDCIDDMFISFMQSQYKLPISTSKQGILMQFGRRCASCDAFYLGAVHMARGLVNPDSVWGRTLSQVGQNKWKEVITGRLNEMGMLQEVSETPALFLEERKKKAVEFSQWCHYSRLGFANGTSADLMRIGRPYGVLPAVESLQLFRAGRSHCGCCLSGAGDSTVQAISRNTATSAITSSTLTTSCSRARARRESGKTSRDARA
jgi:hypothetical protein